MQIQIFTIPIISNKEDLELLNRFLRSHKIIDVEQQLINTKQGDYWSFCIRYLVGAVSFQQSTKKKTDYKEKLDEKSFANFSILRECRKQIASQDAVPAYAVFTDEELAGIACMPEIVPAKMIAIKGIGDKKTERFANRIVDLYNQKINEKGK